MSNFWKVGSFFSKFGFFPCGCGPDPMPKILDDETFLFRYQHLQEELLEMLDAHRKKDLNQFADAIADVLYLAYGVAHLANVPIDEVFAEVHAANMRKVRAQDTNNKRGSKIDVIKPEGWTPPNIALVLQDFRERINASAVSAWTSND